MASLFLELHKGVEFPKIGIEELITIYDDGTYVIKKEESTLPKSPLEVVEGKLETDKLNEIRIFAESNILSNKITPSFGAQNTIKFHKNDIVIEISNNNVVWNKLVELIQVF